MGVILKFLLTSLHSAIQGGAKRLPKYHLVGENCVLIGENLFDLPYLVGENICLLKLCVALRGPDGVSRDAGLNLFCLRDSGLVTKFRGIRDSN